MTHSVQSALDAHGASVMIEDVETVEEFLAVLGLDGNVDAVQSVKDAMARTVAPVYEVELEAAELDMVSSANTATEIYGAAPWCFSTLKKSTKYCE